MTSGRSRQLAEITRGMEYPHDPDLVGKVAEQDRVTTVQKTAQSGTDLITQPVAERPLGSSPRVRFDFIDER